mmetsp:Transcript_14258/g.14898  ORF Transcript_14258/g.14898 Transcript_14258/m.14898 type:complete len:336 (+) Transcript_14258:23-1030(+)|eukprot:CAMPEP_0174817916 /NCGR_PEP_ID=MMETSP1107-20130205/472_1 /TAXON_ID=36770 /ORGANISM="Paraphysomonas vestita, Strain GFlagA" /LENGTH=335 /DNA_ID=CAMNT_0016029051 /DNA_START=23 /DNA_END=1030 /DNA_ORIENTATION=+
MWFGSPEKNSMIPTNPPRGEGVQYNLPVTNPTETILQALNTTTCFDLMRNSSKIVLFETTIPFQQAFLALVEHETDVAPIWDPERRTFVAMMTTRDYYQIKKRKSQLGVSLQSQSISDILLLEEFAFIQNEFHSIDAEDSVKELSGMLDRLDVEYISVLDSDEGNLVAVLGYMDILHLLAQLAQRYPSAFSTPIESLQLRNNISATAPINSTLNEVVDIMYERNISCIPITDNNQRVVGFYQYSDTAFISKLSPTSDLSVLSNLDNQIISDILEVQSTQTNHPNYNPTCHGKDSIKSVIEQMVSMRLTKLVYVDQNGICIGIIRAKDILNGILPE